jgi:cell division protease FtsH
MKSGKRAAMDSKDKRLAVFAAAAIGILVLVALANLFQSGNGQPLKQVSYSAFLDEVDARQVASVTTAGDDIIGRLVDGAYFRTYAASDPDLVQRLREARVTITATPPAAPEASLPATLLALLPTVLLIGLFAFFMLRQSGAGKRSNALGKSKAKLLTEEHGRVTFEDVAGVEEAKESLREIVDFLREPGKFERLGGRIPRGVLMVGPPGSGKTLLARAVAGEAGVPFFTISGSDFVEMFVGIGASRVRDMFEQAKHHAPCIIFMDEIDAVGRHRGAGIGQGNDEREQTLNQLLVEIDGFAANQGIILIAATNRPDVLDPALVRSGRFDREVVVDNPDVVGREQILSVHLRKVRASGAIDLRSIARGTPGFSGADLMNLVNEAALLAVRRGHAEIGMPEFEDAKDKVLMGDERRSHVMTEAEKRLIAYREGGRAIVAMQMPAADPVHRASIVPRGRTQGGVTQLPDADQYSATRSQLTARLAILMAGRAAEEIAYGPDDVTSGTADDLEKATKLARTMVTRYGFSAALGPVAYAENEDEVLLGHSLARQQTTSDSDARLIGREVRILAEAGLADAKAILTRHRVALDMLCKALVEKEVLSGVEIAALLSEVAATVPPAIQGLTVDRARALAP